MSCAAKRSASATTSASIGAFRRRSKAALRGVNQARSLFWASSARKSMASGVKPSKRPSVVVIGGRWYALAPLSLAPVSDVEHASIQPAAREAVLSWYRERGRPLAFRRTTDPYAILVSEAMAQQTQAARAAEAWERFMRRFPTVQDLAQAAPADVLRQWAGLGYDRRALALWRAARIIVDEHDGQVPHDLSALEALPGVGPYTARAVAALAFGKPVGAVDVNVRRVLGRVVAGAHDALAAGAMQRHADAAVPADHPGEWTHAVMDIGATVCRPRSPRCDACPLRPWCRYARGDRPGGATTATHAVRERPVRFASTNRWLRGRIMARLRAVPDDDWAVIEGGIGEHDREAVRRAVLDLDHDGLVESRELDGRLEARLRSA